LFEDQFVHASFGTWHLAQTIQERAGILKQPENFDHVALDIIVYPL